MHAPPQDLIRPVPGGRGRDDPVPGRRGAVEGLDQPAVAHHRDAVGQRHHLLEVRGGEQDAEALGGEVAHHPEDLGLGADIDAAAGLVHQQHPGVGHQRLADHHLLLVAAGERADLDPRVRHLDRQLADRPPRRLDLGPSPQMEAAQEAPQARQGEVLGHRQDRHQPVALPVLRDDGEAAADPAGHVARRHPLAVQVDRAAGIGVAAHDAVEQLGPPGAHQPVQAEDLAGPQRQRDMVDGIAAGRARQADRLGPEDLRPRRPVARRREILHGGADHLPHDPGHVDLPHPLMAGDAAVAQHGDEVADPHQLLQPVRDVDDGDALRLQLGDHPEQDLDLCGAEGRGRLVHDQDAGVLRQRLGDLDDLLLADAQVADLGARVDVVLQPAQQLRRPAVLAAMVDAAQPAGQLAGHEDVLRHRQVGAEVQLLEHDADAVPHRVLRAVQHHRPAIDQDAALGRLLDSGDDLHQRRLAGAVLADQHVDRAAMHGEVHALQRHRAGIDLGHPLDLQGRGLGHGAASRLSSAGVTSGFAFGSSRVNTPSSVTFRPTSLSRGRPASVLV